MIARTVLVTGGARGIGKAIVERYRELGHIVLAPTRAELDVAEEQSVRAYAESAACAGVEVLINNAAENKPAALEDVEEHAWRRALDVNLSGPYLLARLLGAAMAKREWGRIVNVGSVYGFVSRPKRSMYTATKAAINGLTRAIAVEWGPRGVLVNAVCPGFVDTDLTRANNGPEDIARICGQVPLGRLAHPKEIATFVAFLGSDDNTYITGQSIPIDGGFLCQ